MFRADASHPREENGEENSLIPPTYLVSSLWHFPSRVARHKHRYRGKPFSLQYDRPGIFLVPYVLVPPVRYYPAKPVSATRYPWQTRIFCIQRNGLCARWLISYAAYRRSRPARLEFERFVWKEWNFRRNHNARTGSTLIESSRGRGAFRALSLLKNRTLLPSTVFYFIVLTSTMRKTLSRRTGKMFNPLIPQQGLDYNWKEISISIDVSQKKTFILSLLH